MQALRAYVRALQAIEKRNAGQPIETPKFTGANQGTFLLREGSKEVQHERINV
jgi:hypothetical protein